MSLLKDLNVEILQPVKLCDSMSAIHISRNSVLRERTKHIEINCHFIREKVLLGIIQPEYVNTREQAANLFTKALHPRQFKYIMSKLNIINIYVQLEGVSRSSN